MNTLFHIFLLVLISFTILIFILFPQLRKREFYKNLITKNWRVKKIVFLFSFLTLVTVVIINLISIEVGYNNSFGQIEFYGFTGMKLNRSKYSIENPVNVEFNYGHDYYDGHDNSLILGHEVEVYLTEEFNNEPDEYISLYKLEFEDDEFITDENKCACTGLIFVILNNRYNNGFDLDIDFSNLDYDEGRIVIRIGETFMMDDLVDDVVVSTETTAYKYVYLYFKISDEKVEFSKRQFN